MTNFTDTVSARPQEERLHLLGSRLARFGSLFLYPAMAIIFLWIGSMKFTDYEASGVSGFVLNSPLVGWWQTLLGIGGTGVMLGIYEVVTGLLFAGRFLSPRFSVVGAGMSVLTFLITLSFLFTTPGVSEPLAGGFPALSAMPGQFLLKDIALLAVSIYCLGESLMAASRTSSR
ncbi:MAG: DUF417 family protein [Rhizobiales bacterium]|jgi:uncharacterized membrane protein YkgB|nr:DUF417 family protein [Hyphomicrobiales bacterium]MDQ3559994.1 YkgB family protein [Pseudomonadota bacterium]